MNCIIVEYDIPCPAQVYCRSMCHTHYRRWLRHGKPKVYPVLKRGCAGYDGRACGEPRVPSRRYCADCLVGVSDAITAADALRSALRRAERRGTLRAYGIDVSRRCERCTGVLVRDRDGYGEDVTCLSCGWAGETTVGDPNVKPRGQQHAKYG